MLFLILAVIIGIGFAFFAVQNTLGVPVQLGTMQFGSVPLYIVVLGSLLLGLAVSGILRMIDWAATGLTLRGKDRQLHKTEENVEQLQQKIHELEEENSRLRNDHSDQERTDLHHDTHEEERPSFTHRLRQSFSR